MSVLGGRERRRLELYDSDKNSLLYAHLLDDDGTGNVQELMRILHDKASEEIEKQEKAKKKAMAVSEASKTNLNLTPTVSAQMKNNAEATDEEVVPTKTKKAKAEVQLLLEDSDNEGHENKGNIVAASPAGALPGIVVDEYTYRLCDLVASDFKMPPQDTDFSLTHEQLIKACKILLYKQNLNSKKNSYEREELANMINERVTQIENLTKSSLEEVNAFLHTVHSDFEHFLAKHKKDHTEIHVRALRQQEDLAAMIASYSQTKQSVDNYATVLSCLIEFQSME